MVSPENNLRVVNYAVDINWGYKKGTIMNYSVNSLNSIYAAGKNKVFLNKHSCEY